MSTLIATITKNSRETLHVSLDEFKGVKLIDMRVFVPLEASGVGVATKKGLSLRVDLLPEMRAALEKAEAEARAAGLIGGDA